MLLHIAMTATTFHLYLFINQDKTIFMILIKHMICKHSLDELKKKKKETCL